MDFLLTYKRAAAAMVGMLLVVPLYTQPLPSAVQNAAVHSVTTIVSMRSWLSRVPRTKDYPPDFAAVLSDQAPLYVIEMSTAPGCLPCADMWAKLGLFQRRYRWQRRIIGSPEALLRSGRLGLPWVGHPVVWVRPLSDPDRTIPIAIGTDHEANIARNAYLAAKMLTGVKPAAGLRAMAKYTGIVAAAGQASGGRASK